MSYSQVPICTCCCIATLRFVLIVYSSVLLTATSPRSQAELSSHASRDFRSSSPRAPTQTQLQQQQQQALFRQVFHPNHSNFTDALDVSRYRDVTASSPTSNPFSAPTVAPAESPTASDHVFDCPLHPDNIAASASDTMVGAVIEQDSSVDMESEVDKYVAEYWRAHQDEDGYDEGAPSVYIKRPDPAGTTKLNKHAYAHESITSTC